MNIFIYGTLLDDVLRSRLIGRAVSGQPATLVDHVVLEWVSGPSPALVPRPGEATSGLLFDLTQIDAARLDTYEVPFGYRPDICEVQTADGTVSAQVYRPDETVEISDRKWSLSKWSEENGDLLREMALEIGSYEPPLVGKDLKAQWHMIALRANVRLRARRDITPSCRRYQPDADDVHVGRQAQLHGSFFKHAAFDVTHKTFQGDSAGPLAREVLIGCDAAIVLPYDPGADTILLVEQIRMGPLVRGVSNPWSLEPVAGMIDAGESPEQAARRETQEEAGLSDFALHHMFSFYPTPGSSTDYFYCYLAVGALPDPTTYTGGLAAENEDLRIHVLPFDEAMELVETGEANIGPLIATLLWLARNRDQFRASA